MANRTDSIHLSPPAVHQCYSSCSFRSFAIIRLIQISFICLTLCSWKLYFLFNYLLNLLCPPFQHSHYIPMFVLNPHTFLLLHDTCLLIQNTSFWCYRASSFLDQCVCLSSTPESAWYSRQHNSFFDCAFKYFNMVFFPTMVASATSFLRFSIVFITLESSHCVFKMTCSTDHLVDDMSNCE